MRVVAPWDTVIVVIEIALFAYFTVCNLFYAFTAVGAILLLPRFVRLQRVDPTPPTLSSLDPPISVLIPAYNERELIGGAVRSLLTLDYSEFEVIVVNDGSTDDTLLLLSEEFELETFPGARRVAIPTEEIRGIYRSLAHPSLFVIDKVNGGKGDALNAGINISRYPLIFAGDGDSHYDRAALRYMVEPMKKDERTVGVGSAIAVANGCAPPGLDQPFVPRLPARLLPRFQALEYLRGFLSTRMGWARVNALAIVSGASALWRKDVVVEAGGYRTDTIWEDMEMTLRVHNLMRSRRVPYRIAYTPYPVCWTNVPDTIRSFYRQRRGWSRHLSECMTIHRRLFGKGGVLGLATMPFLVLYEWLASIFVGFGILFTFVGLAFGFLDVYAQILLLLLVILLSVQGSLVSVLLDQISYNVYGGGVKWPLIRAALLENFGYRQLASVAALAGLCSWVLRKPVRPGAGRPPGIIVAAYRPPGRG